MCARRSTSSVWFATRPPASFGGAAVLLALLASTLGGCQVLDKKPQGPRGTPPGASTELDLPGDAERLVLTPGGERTSRSEPIPAGMDELTRAKILKEQGALPEALAQFQAAIEENPLLTAAYMGAGEIQLKTGDLPGAEKSYGQAAQLEPFNFTAQYWHAVVLQELQQFSKAIPAYLRALQLRPDSFEGNNGLAATYLQAGEPREALPYAQRAVELNPEDYSARTTLGAIYAALGDHESAIVEFQQAAEMGELSPKLLLNLAESYGRTRRFDEMVNTLDEVVRRDPSAPAYERMGSGLFRLGRFEEALDAFTKATELDNSHFPAFNGVGVCMLQRWLASGQTDKMARDEGLRALRRSLQIKKDQPRVLELVGRHQ